MQARLSVIKVHALTEENELLFFFLRKYIHVVCSIVGGWEGDVFGHKWVIVVSPEKLVRLTGFAAQLFIMFFFVFVFFVQNTKFRSEKQQWVSVCYDGSPELTCLDIVFAVFFVFVVVLQLDVGR